MTSGEFHQLVALIQGQFMQIDRRLGEISRRLDRLEQSATGPQRPDGPERQVAE